MSLPLSTYRLQMRAELGFDEVAGLANYLAELGVSHLYASPYFQAQPGSTHGYDVIDHTRPSDDMGGAAAHERMCVALAKNGLGHVIDIVPNHMSIADRANRWWWDVLENGQGSQYASYFDVDWHPPEERLRNLVVLPILGNHIGRILERGEIQVKRDHAVFTLHYFDHQFPLAPGSLIPLLMRSAKRSSSEDLSFLVDMYRRLCQTKNEEQKCPTLRQRDKAGLRRWLDRVCREDQAAAAAIDHVLAEVNADPEELGALLDKQNYRLTFWRTAGEELVYRRFFDINSLVGLRMNDPQVFADTHALALEWIRRGMVDGLRVDHPDGLYDPEEYFIRLREAAPECWIVAEKILQPGEDLPALWPVHGTTGYDFLNELAGVMIDPSGEVPLTRFYEEFTGETRSFAQCVIDGKQQVLREAFASDIHRLTSMFVEVCERHARYRDYTRRELRSVIREVMASYPVYRTYARAGCEKVGETDARYINQAIDTARTRLPELDANLFHFLRELLLLHKRGDLEHQFAMRFQQATGAAVAKGVEDTAFYNYNRMLALNEVGGDPGTFGRSLEDFHHYCQHMQATWPATMTTTTTHDTKRSEDVRARLYLLSEIPEEWIAAVQRWSRMNEKFRHDNKPSRNFEYAFYQNLFGAWPIDKRRALVNARKTIREEKVHTSWLAPQSGYEDAVVQFVEGVFSNQEFVRDLEQFVAKHLRPARINALAQAFIKLTAPGVPDIYQGNELWDHSLVDPDNRRLVDFEHRRKLLKHLEVQSIEQIMERMDDGLPKLWLTRQVLRLRKRRPDLFGAAGSYSPMWSSGNHAECVLAFRRGNDCMVAAPLRVSRMWGQWGDTHLTLPSGNWKNEFTGESFRAGATPVQRLWQKFPVALLVKEP